MSSADVPEVRSKSLLSDETLAALQLARQPFVRVPESGDEAEVELFADDITAEQLADVRHALITGDDLLLVLGEEGAGKSSLLAQLAANSGLRIQCFSVNGGQRFSTRNLFVGMLEAFKVRPPDNLKATLDELIPCLQAMIGNNTLCVVVLDDADKVSEPELTKLLSGMLYLNSRDESLLRVAFAAPPAFEERIPDLLPEGADLPYSSLMLDPFGNDRAGLYLAHLLQQASDSPRAVDTPVFDDEAVAALNDHAGGLPAALNAAAAAVLDARHGPESRSLIDVPTPLATDADSVYADEDELPPELRDSANGNRGLMGGLAGMAAGNGGGLLDSRWTKFGLGALALLLIVGGLSLFGSGADDGATRYRTVEQRPTLDGSDPGRLELVDKQATRSADAGTDDELVDDAADSEDEGVALEPASGDGGSSVNDVAEVPVNPAVPSVTEKTDPGVAQDDSEAQDAAGSDPAAGDAPGPVEGNDAGAAAEADEEAAESEGDADADAADPDAAQSAPDDPLDGTSDGTSTDASGEQSDEALLSTDSAADSLAIGQAVGQAAEQAVEAVEPVDESLDEPARADTGSGDDSEVAEPSAVAPTSDLAEREVPEDSPVRDPSGPLTGALESPNWILVQTPRQWTIQMSASTDRDSVEQFLARAQLQAPNSIYSFSRNGRTWFALVHGLYPSIDAARDAIDKMPSEATSNQPWIRAVGRIQRALKESN